MYVCVYVYVNAIRIYVHVLSYVGSKPGFREREGQKDLVLPRLSLLRPDMYACRKVRR